MRKQQSAMEYLMTYGWSILIIAIVLAALFSLGVFSSSNLGPRAQPNSCRVYRPNGAGTTTNINLEGVCNNEIPEYVASFNSFTQISIPTSTTLQSVNTLTISVWFRTPNYGVDSQEVILSDYGNTPDYTVFIEPSNEIYIELDGSLSDHTCGGVLPTVTDNLWHNAIFTKGNGNVYVYLDGKQNAACGDIEGNIANSYTVQIGVQQAYYWYNGQIANIQLYNSPLDANEVQSLWLEGIGGVPVEPQYLVAWWPLNGDTKDYSGNGNNGNSNGEAFTSVWSSAYTAP